MSKNYIKEVANLLGVEIGEKFNIKDERSNPYHFDERQCLIDKNGFERSAVLKNLLLGICEIEKPILNNSEREYLKNVIRPFKDEVEYIRKRNNIGDFYIAIRLKNKESVILPYFKNKNMYKGMEVDMCYTVKELKLFEDVEC